MPKRAHTLPPTTPLSQQVGGHAGVQVTEDESLLLKPAQPNEIAFYQLVRDVADPSSGVHVLADWMPQFLGVLNLEGRLAEEEGGGEGGGGGGGVGTGGRHVVVPVSVSTSEGNGDDIDNGNGNGNDTAANLAPQTLVLQNLLYGYRKPCVLDVKLGTVLYDQDTPPEKKARMIKKAAASTTLQTGMRLTGFQVYSNHAPDPVVYGREYGYSLKPDQLQEGIRHFFPSSETNIDPPETASSYSGLPPNTLFDLLTSLLASLTDLRRSLSLSHLRMVGSSVLIIYEADWLRVAAASGQGGGPSSVEEKLEEDDGESMDEIEVEVDEQGEIIMESIPGMALETTSPDLSEEEEETDPSPRLYTVSLIDFAHTRVVPGQGPDEGVLKGMDTLISLVQGRQREVEALIKRQDETRLDGGVRHT